jgi:hypothetical protein
MADGSEDGCEADVGDWGGEEGESARGALDIVVSEQG